MNIDRTAQLALRDIEERSRAMLTSAIDKVARKYERLSRDTRDKADGIVTLKLTVGELSTLKQFHSKFHED